MKLTKQRQNEIDQKIAEMLLSLNMSYPENNIEEIVKAKDIKIEIQDLSEIEEKVSGIIFSKNGQTTIFLNQVNSPVRQAFSLAHELGHYILHDLDVVDGVKLRLDKYNYSDDTKVTKEETEANYFAASLLVPKDKLIIAIKNTSNISEVAKYFGVSEQVIANRIRWINAN